MIKHGVVFLLLLTGYNLLGQDRPNILWLVCEDMSPYLSCYGNRTVKTPNLDRLAEQGIRYTRAHANGAQCSPSRSTLISGVYAVSLGTDVHREKRPFPEHFYFPRYLREAGYYTSNNNKQDYNNMKTPENVWNESSKDAGYQNRADKSQPFFSVYNCGITHMARVATLTVEGRQPRKVSPATVQVPPYIPDLPEVRDDIAWNMDAVALMDQWMGKKLNELEKSGEADNTIIFFYSDHGGTVPRGKAYIYETGTQVPLIVYFPPKWKHLAGSALPAVSNRLVSFIDFAPTIMSLTGIKKPSFMTGNAFLGPAAAVKGPDYIFTFRANQGDSYAPSRAITDGHYKLIRNYQSAYPNGTRQDYQWQMPAQQAWDVANREGQIKNDLQKSFWIPVEPFELYDISSDSLETRNLAKDPRYSQHMNQLKQQLDKTVRQQKDLGFIPREYRKILQADGPLYEVARKNNLNVDQQIAAAENASVRDISQLPLLLRYLKDTDPVVQYWGASGICGLARCGALKKNPEAVPLPTASSALINEARCMLAEAMVYTGDDKGLRYLYNQLEADFGPAAAALQNVGALAKPLVNELKQMLATKTRNRYRFYIRSVLINCNALPYKDLYNSAEKVAD